VNALIGVTDVRARRIIVEAWENDCLAHKLRHCCGVGFLDAKLGFRLAGHVQYSIDGLGRFIVRHFAALRRLPSGTP